MRRAAAIAAITARLDDALVVTANGFVARELQAAEDRPENFYMLGSMGLASTIALGLAIARPHRRVVVLDGDGNLLMGLGHLAMIGERGPENLCHLVLDNHAYESTGGQRAISDRVALDRLAAAAGYRHVDRVTTAGRLPAAVDEAFAAPGPSFLLVEVEGGNLAEAGRVRASPPEIAERVRRCAAR